MKKILPLFFLFAACKKEIKPTITQFAQVSNSVQTAAVYFDSSLTGQQNIKSGTNTAFVGFFHTSTDTVYLKELVFFLHQSGVSLTKAKLSFGDGVVRQVVNITGDTVIFKASAPFAFYGQDITHDIVCSIAGSGSGNYELELRKAIFYSPQKQRLENTGLPLEGYTMIFQ